MELTQLIGYVLSAVALIVTTIFYLRYTATKANIDGKNETIKTQVDQIEALKEEVTRKSSEAEGYKKQAEALREIAQQTPQIILLTESITKLTDSIQRQHSEDMRERKAMTAILEKLIPEGKNETSTH